jgi:preprotein translocase subunit SecB
MAEQEQNTAEKQIAIQKIYVKDFSFESPHTPDVFAKQDWSPKTNLNLRSSHTTAAENSHEVVLTITIEAKDDDQTYFLVELHQAGLFHISGYNEEEFKAIVGSYCPNILFPYARETVATVVSKGGFPEFLLQPINFDSLYQQGMAQAQAQDAEQATTEPAPGSGSNGGGNGGEA